MWVPFYSGHPVDDSAGRITREFLWPNQEFSPVDIIPPWLSKLISPGGWWPQFRVVDLPHRYEHDMNKNVWIYTSTPPYV